MKKHIFALVAALAVILSGLVVTAPAVYAATASDWCTGPNQSIDANSGNCVTNTVTAGNLEASVDETLTDEAYLKMITKGNVVFNVHVNPIPKRKIKRCWTVKPGTKIKNEVRSQDTGQLIIIDWIVPADDNTFCTEKGHGSQVFKKSCGNRTWNVPGQPHQPKPPSRTVKGSFTVVDYAKWAAKLKAYLFKHLTGSLSVESPDSKCKASASFDNVVRISTYLTASFRSRFRSAAMAKAVKEIDVEATNSTTAKGMLASEIDLTIHNTLSAMCETSSPPATCPSGTTWNDSNGNGAVDQGECEQPTPQPVLTEITTVNDVVVNNSRTLDVSGSVAPNHGGTLTCTANNGGTITAGKTQSVSGQFTKQITYTAPSEVPSGGYDSVTCNVMQDDGQHDEITSNQFAIKPAPVDPL